MLVHSILIVLVVWLTIKVSALPETQYIKRTQIKPSPEDKKLNKRYGCGEEAKTRYDAETQALWEAYWKTHPENAWDATPSYAGYDSQYGTQRHFSTKSFAI